MRIRRRATAAVVGGLVAVLGLAVPRASGATTWTTTRISGDDRYATAAALSAHAFPTGAAEVVLASGADFADALAASPAAARRKAPLLLTQRDAIPATTLAEIRRLHPKKVLIAGGPAAVGVGVEFALALSTPVTRVAGADRFQTAAKLADTTFGTGVPVLFLAQGRAFPDALAAGAAAGRLGGPVLLVEQSQLTASVSAEIDHLRPAKIVLVGGTSVISAGIQTALATRAQVQRIAGRDRYATAAALVDAVPGPATVAFVASGAAFPDALAAGPSAAAMAGDFALAGPSCLTTEAAQHLVDDGVRELVVVGGESALSSAATKPCSPVTATTTTSTTAKPTTTTTVKPTTTTTALAGGGGGGGGSSAPAPTTTVPGPTTTTTVAPAPTSPVLTVQGSVPDDSPDPTILKVGSRWYAYSTQVLFSHMPVRSSTDLVTWSAGTDAMPAVASWVEEGSNWAPSVVQSGSVFVAWYAAKDQATGRQCVSRAVASDPAGPFVDELTAAPVCQTSLGGSIDPHVFTDNDGSRWLTWKSDENAVGNPARLWVAALSADGKTVTGTPSVILAETAAWESPTIEQPALVRSGTTYYLFYSGGWWESAGYGVGYATASAPTGPFTKKTTTAPWLATKAAASGPGALDVFTGPDGGLWATYHAWPGVVGYAAGGLRTMRVAKLQL